MPSDLDPTDFKSRDFTYSDAYRNPSRFEGMNAMDKHASFGIAGGLFPSVTRPYHPLQAEKPPGCVSAVQGGILTVLYVFGCIEVIGKELVEEK
jgi:hypothetical protein